MENKTVVILFAAGLFCLLAAILIMITDFYFRRRSLRRMYGMIQSAIDGTFQADVFDESLHAAVENKLAEYLSVAGRRWGR